MSSEHPDLEHGAESALELLQLVASRLAKSYPSLGLMVDRAIRLLDGTSDHPRPSGPSDAEPAFDELMRHDLWMGKYTRDYESLTRGQLKGLLWLLDEWRVRAPLEPDPALHPRAKSAYRALINFTTCKLTLDEVRELIARELRGY